MDMQRHIQELKRMRQICRDEGVTNRSLAEHFACTEQSIFEILEGVTKESDLRNKVYTLLTTRELLEPFLGDGEHGAAIVPVQTGGDLYAAWKALGISQGELAERFNRSPMAINPILKGRVTGGPLYNALRAHLLEGKEAVCLDAWPQRIVQRNASPLPAKAKQAPAAPVVYAPSPAPVVVQIVQNDDPDEVLRAQIMALEELTEATKDLLVAREAQRRYSAAVAIARRVGLNVNSHERQTAAA